MANETPKAAWSCLWRGRSVQTFLWSAFIGIMLYGIATREDPASVSDAAPQAGVASEQPR